MKTLHVYLLTSSHSSLPVMTLEYSFQPVLLVPMPGDFSTTAGLSCAAATGLLFLRLRLLMAAFWNACREWVAAMLVEVYVPLLVRC